MLVDTTDIFLFKFKSKGQNNCNFKFRLFYDFLIK